MKDIKIALMVQKLRQIFYVSGFCWLMELPREEFVINGAIHFIYFLETFFSLKSIQTLTY